MMKKIIILILFVLISLSAVSAVDLDGNDNVVASSSDDAMLAVENDFNTVKDLKENTADGGNITLEKNNNVLSAAVSENRENNDEIYMQHVDSNSSLLGDNSDYAEVIYPHASDHEYDPDNHTYLKLKNMYNGEVILSDDHSGEFLYEFDEFVGFLVDFGVLNAGTYEYEVKGMGYSGSVIFRESFTIEEATPNYAEVIYPHNYDHEYDPTNSTFLKIMNIDFGFVHLYNEFDEELGEWNFDAGLGFLVDFGVLNAGNYAYLGYDHWFKKEDNVMLNEFFTIDQATAEINVEDESINLAVGDEKSINAVLNPNVGSLSYSSANPEIATVTSDGIITAMGGGSTNITVSLNNTNYKASSKNVTVKVKVKDNKIYVNGSVQGPGDGSQTNPYQTLNESIGNASDGNTIFIAPGTYAGK